MSRHISNRFVIVSNIQIIIRMLYYSFEKLFLLGLFYLIVKSGKSLVIIGSRFQIALFFWFYRNFQPLTSLIPTLPLSYPSPYFILPNVTTPPPPAYYNPLFIRTQEYLISRSENNCILQIFNFAIWWVHNISQLFNFAISVKIRKESLI